MTLKEAIRIMKEQVKDEYALGYIVALDGAIEEDGMKGLVAQVRYIRENIRYWRGGKSKEVRAFLDGWLRDKKEVA
jgi:hypothetical protein